MSNKLKEVIKMSGLIFIILIIGILYIALTYFKGPRNTYTNSNGLTTRPFGGEDAGNEGVPPEMEDTKEEPETDETDANQDSEAEEADEAEEVDESEEAIEAEKANTGVIIDSEVLVDTRMSSDMGVTDTPDRTDK